MAKTYQQLLDEARAAVPELSVDQVGAEMDKAEAPVVLDVREKEEFRDGHLPGALSIPRGFLEMLVEGQMPDKDRPVIAYCQSGVRSLFAGKILNPLYSLMVATEPLGDDLLRDIGLRDRQTFSDYRNLIIYGQRTADGRLAFGGRGAPYHWGSSIEDRFDINDGVHAELVRVLVDLFPQLSGYDITHRWGGPLGVSRDWRPSVTVDRDRGVSWAGGYVGDGVNTAHMAGQTLAELITGTTTERTSLPWVNHRWPKWEPEPFRFIGINAGLALAKSADKTEARTGRHSRKADLGLWLRGRNRQRI